MKTDICIDMVLSIGDKYLNYIDSSSDDLSQAYHECDMSALFNSENKTLDISIFKEVSVYLVRHKNKERNLERIAIDNNDIISIIYNTISDSCNLAVKLGIWGSSEDRILRAVDILVNTAISRLYSTSNNITESKNSLDWMWGEAIDDVHLGVFISEIENRTTNTSKPTPICYYNTKNPVCIDDMVYIYDVQYPSIIFEGIVKEYRSEYRRDVLEIVDTDTNFISNFGGSYLVFPGREDGLEEAKQVIKEKIDKMDKILVDTIHGFTDSLKDNIIISANPHDKYCSTPTVKQLSIYYNPTIDHADLVYSDNIDYMGKER